MSQRKNKEEMFNELINRHDIVTHRDVSMMLADQYAQQESISFLKWVKDKKYCPNSSGLWFDYTLSREQVRFYTEEQLYLEFRTGIKYNPSPLFNPINKQQMKQYDFIRARVNDADYDIEGPVIVATIDDLRELWDAARYHADYPHLNDDFEQFLQSKDIHYKNK